MTKYHRLLSSSVVNWFFFFFLAPSFSFFPLHFLPCLVFCWWRKPLLRFHSCVKWFAFKETIDRPKASSFLVQVRKERKAVEGWRRNAESGKKMKKNEEKKVTQWILEDTRWHFSNDVTWNSMTASLLSFLFLRSSMLCSFLSRHFCLIACLSVIPRHDNHNCRHFWEPGKKKREKETR